MKQCAALLGLALFLTTSSLVHAQAPRAAETTNPGEVKAEGKSGARREQIRERIRTVRLMRLVETLELDNQKAIEVNKVMTQYEDKQRDLAVKRREAIEKLEHEVRAQSPNEASLKKYIAEVLVLEEDFAKIRASEFQDVSKMLNPVQQGKFIVFRHNFSRAVGDAVRQRHADRRGDSKPTPSPVKKP